IRLHTQALHLAHFSCPHSPPTPYFHSFPTRRSSDLLRSPTKKSETVSQNSTQALWARTERTRFTVRRLCWSYLPIKMYRPICMRSEEHTSELQSRFDLVCRLLLE